MTVGRDEAQEQRGNGEDVQQSDEKHADTGETGSVCGWPIDRTTEKRGAV